MLVLSICISAAGTLFFLLTSSNDRAIDVVQDQNNRVERFINSTN